MKNNGRCLAVLFFLDGRWKLTDAKRKYDLWTAAIDNLELAERLFSAALNLAENRRGGLLVVLDDPRTARKLVSKTDLLSYLPEQDQDRFISTKDQLHYLLHQKRILEVPMAILETIARIDGAIVLDRDSNLLAFGAILRHQNAANLHPENIEGGRTTAAIAASQFGSVLKISEDGVISFFQNGKCVWDI
jgi:DNA integrity scanning protein DisA with diadenylate cyclase activity